MFGLAPHFLNVLEGCLKRCDNYVLCFDESLNKISQKSQMDIFVRYWNEENNLVKCSYLTSVFIEGRATAQNLLTHFLKGNLPVLRIKNISQISMDGPNVNWKLIELFNDEDTDS